MDKVPFRTFRAEFESLDRRMIKRQLEETANNLDINIHEDRLIGKHNGLFIDLWYKWKIERDAEKNVYILTETTFTGKKWFILLSITLYGLAVAIGLQGSPEVVSLLFYESGSKYVFNRVSSFLITISMAFWAVSSFPIYFHISVASRMRGTYESFSTLNLYRGAYSFALIFLLISVFLVSIESYLLVFLCGVLLLTFSRQYMKYVFGLAGGVEQPLGFNGSNGFDLKELLMFGKFSFRPIQNRITELFDMPYFPRVYLYYIGTVATASISLWLFPFTVYALADPQFIDLFMVLSALFSLFLGIYLLSKSLTMDAALDSYYSVKYNPGGVGGKFNKIIFTGTASIFSFALLIMAIFGLSMLGYFDIGIKNYILEVPGFQQPSLSSFVFYKYFMTVTVVVILSYFLFGLTWQIYYLITRKIRPIISSSKADLDLDSDAKVLLDNSEDQGPSSLSTGFNDYIFLPEQALGKLSEEELKAVIKHEEFHIKNNDALLAMYMPILGLLLLTGQNVLFNLFDFRNSEFSADEYAARHTSSEIVQSAIDSLGGSNTDLEPKSRLEKIFGLFYGGFALSEAHPSPNQRKRNLRNL